MVKNPFAKQLADRKYRQRVPLCKKGRKSYDRKKFKKAVD